MQAFRPFNANDMFVLRVPCLVVSVFHAQLPVCNANRVIEFFQVCDLADGLSPHVREKSLEGIAIRSLAHNALASIIGIAVVLFGLKHRLIMCCHEHILVCYYATRVLLFVYTSLSRPEGIRNFWHY